MQNSCLANVLIGLLFAGPVLQAQVGWQDSLTRAGGFVLAGKYDEAQRTYGEALQNMPPGAGAQSHAYILSQMADLNILFGHAAAAERQTRDAVTLLEAAGKDHTRELALALGILAGALAAQGKYTEAVTRAKLAISIGVETLDPDTAELAMLLATQAQILRETGRPRPALILARRSMEIFERLGPPRMVDLGTAYLNLALHYSANGNGIKAVEYCDKAMAVWRKALPANHPYMVCLLSARATIYLKSRRFDQAVAIVPSMLELEESSFGRGSPTRITLLNHAALIYIAVKRYVEAEVFLREGVQLADRLLPAGHPESRSLLLQYSGLLEKLDRKEEAALMRSRAAVVLAASIGAPQQ